MTMMEFFGCGFIAFGPALALFIFTIASDPLRVIVFIASAFFWLLALLLSSLWWYAVVPLRGELAFGLVFSVLFQELFRLLYYLMLRKAQEGLKRVWKAEAGGPLLVNNKVLMAYVSGLGFGVMSGAFSLINVLADMTGPGTIGIFGDSPHFFITSAFTTLCFVMLHTFWGIVFCVGLDKKQYLNPSLVVLSHMLVSCLTLLNERDPPLYLASLVPAYGVLVAMASWCFFIAGGNMRTLRAFFSCRSASYEM